MYLWDTFLRDRMKAVIYSLNGQKLKDYKVYISESKGLLDKLKPKNRVSYDWAEYHGKAVDTSPAKYEEREITLSGWIEGENWQEIKRNFDRLLSEFDKEGLVRLVVDFGDKLVFDVYLYDGVELNKNFSQGQTIGRFTLKMKEPNPIKKTLSIGRGRFNLKFTALSWIDININGINRSMKGNVDIHEDLSENENYITIAGNLEDIKNLETNATILWEN